MTIDETCSCGARCSITIADHRSDEIHGQISEWRREHKHTEEVGICGNRAQTVYFLDRPMPIDYCELKHGHPGAHQTANGTRTWTHGSDA